MAEAGLSPIDLCAQTCSVCGGNSFKKDRVLWPGLIAEWQLDSEEVAYIDRQQGLSCLLCSANLRVIVLANAIREIVGDQRCIREIIADGLLDRHRILDCNGVAGLSEALADLPFYQRANYPAFDLHRLPFSDGEFDLIFHSDTLEHVSRPLVALRECRRVLRSRGFLCFTAPMIIGRMSRSRAGMTPSYHGNPGQKSSDLLVHTEFGADLWTFPIRAGFAGVKLNQVDFPSAIAITAWRDTPPTHPVK